MSTELNMEAERAAFERVYAELNHSTPGGGWNDFDNTAGRYHEEDTHDAWVFWQAARRTVDTSVDTTAPVSAPIVEELPPLPHKIGTVYNGNYWTQSDTVNPPGEKLADVFDAEQVRKAQRDAIAPYAERIRQLERELSEHKAARIAYASEFAPDADGDPDVGSIHANIRSLKRELAERKTASIEEDNKFQCLLYHYVNARSKLVRGTPTEDEAIAAFRALIAYIDGRTAGTAPEGWKLAPIEATSGMQIAALDASRACDLEHGQPSPLPKGYELWSSMYIYRAMIAAAPTPTEGAK